MIGSIICFKVGDALGRRREILIAAVLFFIGAVVEAASGSSVWSGDWGLVVLMIGRVSYGVGCGFAMHGVRFRFWYRKHGGVPPVYSLGEDIQLGVRVRSRPLYFTCRMLNFLAKEVPYSTHNPHHTHQTVSQSHTHHKTKITPPCCVMPHPGMVCLSAVSVSPTHEKAFGWGTGCM